MEHVFKIGDKVLLKGASKDQIVIVDGGMIKLSSPRGALDTKRLIGLHPGEIINIGQMEITAYRPDVLDHILNLERGPQVIIPKDSSRIVMELGLSPGHSVIEGGAGSGALSIALLNAVGPLGTVHSYDIREDHLEKAGRNIERAGLKGWWEGKLGDIGEGIKERGFDAFVLDVPEPEKTVTTAATALRSGGRFCSYVPTVNQMERTVLSLREAGFQDVRGFELIERGFSVKEGATRPVTEILAHTGFIVTARWMGSP